MRVALDTNVVVYLLGGADDARHVRAISVVDALASETVVVPVQVLGETYRVLTRKLALPVDVAEAALDRMQVLFPVAPTTAGAFAAAVRLARMHRLQIWDALVMAVAAEAGCTVLLSEDMQDGFRWNGLTVCNPFAVEHHPVLAALLRQPS